MPDLTQPAHVCISAPCTCTVACFQLHTLEAHQGGANACTPTPQGSIASAETAQETAQGGAEATTSDPAAPKATQASDEQEDTGAPNAGACFLAVAVQNLPFITSCKFRIGEVACCIACTGQPMGVVAASQQPSQGSSCPAHAAQFERQCTAGWADAQPEYLWCTLTATRQL